MLVLKGKKKWHLKARHDFRRPHGQAWKHCTQLPGDLLFQPTHCYHGAENLEETMGVTSNGWNGYTAHHVIPSMWASLQDLDWTDDDLLFSTAKKLGLLRWLFLRFITSLLQSPQVTSTVSFRHFAKVHSDFHNRLIHEARSLDIQLSALGLLSALVCVAYGRRKLWSSKCGGCKAHQACRPTHRGLDLSVTHVHKL